MKKKNKKLFNKHSVVNVYFNTPIKEIKEEVILDSLKDICEIFDYKLRNLITVGNYYIYPYFTSEQAYIKIGIKESISYSELLKTIKKICNDKDIKYSTHKFLFQEVHHNIELIKFVAYEFKETVKNSLIKNKKFTQCSSRNVLMGCDFMPESLRGNLTSDEWLHLFHHVFLGLQITYNQEAYIYSNGANRINYNINQNK